MIRHDIIMAQQKSCELVARPVATSCSDLPQRPVWLDRRVATTRSDLPRRSVWPDKSRHFVHTFCATKLHLVATCHDSQYYRTLTCTSGIIVHGAKDIFVLYLSNGMC